MATHKYSVGQKVWYMAERGVDGTGEHIVKHQLPATESGIPQYRAWLDIGQVARSK